MRLLEKLFDARDGSVEHFGNIFRAFVFVSAAFSDFKDAGLGEIQQVFTGAPLRVETGFGNLVSHRNHFTNNGTFTDDISISANVRRTWRIFGEFCQIGKPADAVQLPLSLQRFRERNQVNRASAFLQTAHLCKDVTVRTGIKIFRHHALGNVVPALVVQH